MELLLPGPSASNPFGTPACVRCARGVLGLEDGAETEGGGVSTGPGRLQRRLIEVVEAAENRTMTRRRLEEVLIAEGFDRSNALRSLKRLAERRRVYVHEGHTLDESRVSVPEPVRMLTDEQIAAILEKT
jgi:hypothetical protein